MKINNLKIQNTVKNTDVKSQNGNISEEPKDTYTPGEIGADKTKTQHLANASFGLSSVYGLKNTILTAVGITSKCKFAKYVPGLNVGIAGIETYHAVKHLVKKDPVVAATSAGNAAGCMSSVLEEASTMSAFASGVRHSLAMKCMSSVLGLIGGALGIAAGTAEIKEGMKIKKAGGTGRTLTMGILDIASGITSATGGILLASGVGSVFGLPFLVAASICDLSGIAVDYMWKKSEQRHNGENKPAEN